MLKRLLTSLIYVIIFFTGATGLIYEVTWQKYLSRLLGSDSIATAIILAVFLGGLSAGYYLCGKISFKIRNHFAAYAIAEGIIGIWCLLFPKIFQLVESATASWSFAPPALIIIQGVFCSAVLMGIPTICMGATIPFLTRGISKSIFEATSVHARVYAVNTAGAFLGTLVAGFYLIPEYGLPLTIMGTSGINLLAFMLIYTIQKYVKITAEDAAQHKQTPSSKGQRILSPPRGEGEHLSPYILATIAFLSGFYVMTLENVLIRITNLCLGSSSYTFTLIVSVFIIAIAIGSYRVGRHDDLPKTALPINQSLITLTLLVLYLTLDTWPYWAHIIRVSFQSQIIGFWAFYICVFLVLLLVLVVPIGLMGATVPITFHELKRDLQSVGRHSGFLFSLNTVGNLCGSLIGGILLYHFFNNGQIFSVAIIFAAISTYLSCRHLKKVKVRWAQALVALVVVISIFGGFYNTEHFSVGVFRYRGPLSSALDGIDAFFSELVKDCSIPYYNDGPSATVSVVERKIKRGRHASIRSIYVNGKSDSGTGDDQYTLKISAHLPALMAKSRNKAMVIGLGTGITAGELTLYQEFKKIDVAEISPSVIAALPHFSDYTHQVHTNERVKIHCADAFRFIGRSNEKYDVIISEPSNPWVTGVDLLFTEEFYKLVKDHLAEGGIYLQWVHIYSANKDMVGMIMNTFGNVFENYHSFFTFYGDMILIASDYEFKRSDIEVAKQHFKQNVKVKTSLSKLGINTFEALLAREVLPRSMEKSEFQYAGRQTMDNPRLHYIAGKCFFQGRDMPSQFFYNSNTARYVDDYLLPRLYDNWNDPQIEAKTYRSIIMSLRSLTAGNLMAAFSMKQMLDQGNTVPHPVKLVALIENYTADRRRWEEVGLADATIRQKAATMIKHVRQYRSWIVPYSMSGLMETLRKGIVLESDVLDRNWCRVQLAGFLAGEEDGIQSARSILKDAAVDKNGEILLRPEDYSLIDTINAVLRDNIPGN